MKLQSGKRPQNGGDPFMWLPWYAQTSMPTDEMLLPSLGEWNYLIRKSL